MKEVCRPQEAHYGLGWASGERNLIFYEVDRWILGRDPDWFQDLLLVAVDLFFWVGMETNLEKAKGMVFTLDFIWGHIVKEYYKRRATGEGTTFMERKRKRVSCSECGE